MTLFLSTVISLCQVDVYLSSPEQRFGVSDRENTVFATNLLDVQFNPWGESPLELQALSHSNAFSVDSVRR